MYTEEGSLCAEVVDNVQLRQNSTAPLHNGPAVNKDAPVFKIFHVFQVVATGASNPILEFENHKNQYFSWLLKSRVAELGSLSSGAKMAMKIFVRHVFTKISKKCVNHDKS